VRRSVDDGLSAFYLRRFTTPRSAAPLGLGPSATQLISVAMSIAELVDACPTNLIYLLCRAALAASFFFAHLLQNAI
jgi:hypothetical protein